MQPNGTNLLLTFSTDIEDACPKQRATATPVNR
jgi:hypothetical protein